MLQVLFPVVIAFAVTVLLVLALNPLARRIGWLDKPDARKLHKAAIPLTGGVAMLGGILASAFVVRQSALNVPLVGAMIALCLAGLVDDLFHLSPRFRLLLQGAVAVGICLLTDVRMHSLGNLLGTGEIILPPWLALFLPVFCIMAAVNAINMIDGVDGQAGGVLVVTLLWLVVLLARSGGHLALPLTIAAAIGGYLCFNMRSPLRKKAAVFMGDAGSTMLGLVVTWLLVCYSQPMTGTPDRQSFPPVLALWLMAVPLLDTASLIFSRSLRGHHPFKADRDHIHHILQRAGLADGQVAMVVISLSCLISATGVLAWILGVPDVILFGAFVSGFCAYFYAIHHTQQVARGLRRVLVWQRARRMLRYSIF
jgi:UDP-GlcNAc:undecaprenyl-phosphate GlcNAc-1-phosphate transferase